MHSNEICAPAHLPTDPAAALANKKRPSGLIVNCITALMTLTTLGLMHAVSQTPGSYKVSNILSDGYVPATVVDSNFVDPWGISFGKAFWIDTALTGYSYVTLPNGTTAFKAVVPAVSGLKPGQPTGTVFNSTPGFALSNGSPASFLFASLDGTIWGWNGKLFSSGNISLLAVNNAATQAVYTDIALLTNATSTYLLAANFGAAGRVEVYDQNFKAATLAGQFVDPNLPAGYAPYAIHVIDTKVFVTYTLRSTSTFSETLGTNTGVVDVYDVNGNLVQRAITGGNLNAPWGMALAPAGWGIYGGDLLVGNLGDGLINVYDPSTYAYLGQLIDDTGTPVLASLPTGSNGNYTGLWEIVFGKGTPDSNPTAADVGDSNTLYFVAGLSSETHGLLGAIAAGTPSANAATFGLSTSTQILQDAGGLPASMTLSIEPTNGFNGAVNLACTGLPVGATCKFGADTLAVDGKSAATTTLSIATNGSTKYSMSTKPNSPSSGLQLAFAALMPFGAVLIVRRRLYKGYDWKYVSSRLLLLLVVAGAASGCGGYKSPGVVQTPFGDSQVTVMATSGAITKSTTFSLKIT